MQRHSKLLSLAAVLSLATASAFAQTPTSTIKPTTTPDTVGVTPQAAAEANRKAVPRSDTATLVRTSPTAVDKAKSVTDNNTTTSVNGTSTMPNNANTTAAMPANTAAMNDAPKTTTKRRARADRN